jgi:glycerophosphoryl diester phosphodiesterase
MARAAATRRGWRQAGGAAITWLMLLAPLSASAGHPLNIAHRGGYVLAPENTIPTFLSAISYGVDLIESDVFLTSDGVPILHHDWTVNRTTDGTGLVTGFTLAEIKQLDAGIYFGPEWAGTRIPTVEEAYAAVLPDARFFMEIKDPASVPAFAQQVLDLGVPQSSVETWIRGGNAMADQFHALLPDSRVVFDGYTWYPEALIRERAETCCVGLIVRYQELTPEYVDLVHSYGLSLYTFLVPSPYYESMIDMGVDGVVASAPHVLAAELAGRPDPECSDGVDNDGDGHTDHLADPSCWGALDNAESAECSDGVDNDGDGLTDHPADPSCYGPFSVHEATGCADGIDNNGDGLTDHPDDPGCIGSFDSLETVECWDGIDNDGDGLTDHLEDGACKGPSGTSEKRDCDDGVDNDFDGLTDYPEETGCASPDDDSERAGCWDGIDNDGDGATDYGNDPQCADWYDLIEAPECSDGIDNDGNGLVDHPADPTCASPLDNRESGDLVHLPASGALARLLAALLLPVSAFAVARLRR